MCLEMLPEHADLQATGDGQQAAAHSTICYTILSCLNASL